MGKSKKTKVCLINCDIMPLAFWSKDIYGFSDQEFMKEAKRERNVFSLKGFQNAFNIGDGDGEYPNGIIRFIEVSGELKD